MKRFLASLAFGVVVILAVSLLRRVEKKPAAGLKGRIQWSMPSEPASIGSTPHANQKTKSERPTEIPPSEKQPNPQGGKGEAILASIDWEKLGRNQLDWSLGKIEESDSRFAAESMRYYAAILDLMGLWKEDPELKQRLGTLVLRHSLDGYLRAMGLILSDVQMEAVLASYADQPIEKALELDWWDTGKEGYVPLDSVKNSLQQCLILSQALHRNLSPEQLRDYQVHQPPDPLWPMFRKSISASAPAEAVQKSTDYWMSRYQLSEEHRSAAQRLAQSYYTSFLRMHQEYAAAGPDRRTEIWMETVDAQKQVEAELARLTGPSKPGLMSPDGYQVVTFEP